jgi:hypothetical protein
MAVAGMYAGNEFGAFNEHEYGSELPKQDSTDRKQGDWDVESPDISRWLHHLVRVPRYTAPTVRFNQNTAST